MPSLASHKHIKAEQRRHRRAQSGKPWSVKDLPQYYYHKNFLDILGTIETRYDDLLDTEDRAFITDFRAEPFLVQCAYVRLCNRKGRVFNVDNFNYNEIDNLAETFSELRRAGFTTRVKPSDYLDYLESLNKTDLIQLLSVQLHSSEYKKSWKKSQLVQIAFNKIAFSSVNISETVHTQSRTHTLDYLLYLYSGKVGQALQNQTLHDLGLVNLPKAIGQFGQRFESLESAKTTFFYARGVDFFRAENDPETNALIKSIDEWPEAICPYSEQARDKLLEKLGGLAERRDQIETALRIYSKADTAHCNERLIRLHYKQGDKNWVQSRLETMIENPSCDAEHNFAQDFYARKFKQKRTSSVTDLLRSAETLELDEAYRHQPERAAMQDYREKGFTCFRTENKIWRTLFGLYFWDIIFPESEAHTQISKLSSGTFFSDNEDDIKARLADLDTPHLAMMRLLKTYTKHYGVRQKIFRWRAKALDSIKALINHAPKGAVAKMLRIMAMDWRQTKDGFPDIMLIENDTLRFVEIKAAGDVIRRNQLTRLRQLKSCGFQADIVQISWRVDPAQTYVVVDVETTGGRAGLHRVTEIGAVKVKAGKIIDEWSSLINPQRSIPANITRLTGITNEMVANAPRFGEIAESFAAFMGDAIFAAHNVNFDYGFISAEFKMIDQTFRHPKICTCSSMRKLYPGHASYSLKNLCRDFNIDLTSHHRALCDAKAAAELLLLVNEKRLEEDVNRDQS